MYIQGRKMGLKCIYKVRKWAQNVYTMSENGLKMYIQCPKSGLKCIYMKGVVYTFEG